MLKTKWIPNFSRLPAQALHLVARRFDDISILTQMPLRHLELKAVRFTDQDGFYMLGCLPSLETLAIQVHGKEAELPGLDLSGCARLRACALAGISATELQVPAGCSVLLQSGCMGMMHPCSPACPSCQSKDHDVRSFLTSLFAASTFLEVGNNQTDISLEVGQSLQHLQSLSISGHIVKLSIKVPLRLTSLQALASSELLLRFNHYRHATSMAEALQAYNFKCERGLNVSEMRPLFDTLCDLEKHGSHMNRYHMCGRVPSGGVRVKQTARKRVGPRPLKDIGWVNGIEPGDMSSTAYTAAVDEHFAAHAGSAGATAPMSFAQLHNPVCRFSQLPLTST